MGHSCLMPPRAITGFYPGDYPVNHDVPELIRYLVALTGADPCQTQFLRGKQWLAVITVMPPQNARWLARLGAGAVLYRD